MNRPRPNGFHGRLAHLSQAITRWSGSSWAFLTAAGLTAAWAATGPLFSFSNGWQLVMNTVSSIVTFLMVFLIQRAQNHDALAIQVKLNELIAAAEGASNRLIDVEDLTEEEVARLHRRYQRLAERLRRADAPAAGFAADDLAGPN
jgi:low affinity Fe/Cu permease